MARAFKSAKKTMSAEEIYALEVATKAMEIGVPQAQIARGGFLVEDVRLDDGEKVTTYRTVRNSGSAIDRWMRESPSKLFGEPEKAAIKHCQNLWARIDRKGPPDLSGVHSHLWMGQSEHEALAAISALKRRLPVRQWSCFENIVRFEMDAPSAGREMATNARSAIDGAKMCVAFVAGMVAQWEGM